LYVSRSLFDLCCAVDHAADPRSSSQASLSPGSPSSSGSSSIGRGQFDTAIRDLRNGVTSRRQRSTAERDRPLSRLFLTS